MACEESALRDVTELDGSAVRKEQLSFKRWLKQK
jgi:hypothetical protein